MYYITLTCFFLSLLLPFLYFLSFSWQRPLECFRSPYPRYLYFCLIAIEDCHMGGFRISKQQREFGNSWLSVRPQHNASHV